MLARPSLIQFRLVLLAWSCNINNSIGYILVQITSENLSFPGYGYIASVMKEMGSKAGMQAKVLLRA